MKIATTIAEVRAQVREWKQQGLTVGLVVHGVEAGDRKKAYEADVT